MFYRTIRMLESGMKPIYVFDGAPPEAKRDELSRRAGARGDAAADLAEAKEAGADEEAVAKLAKRTVKVTKVHNEECKRLLRLLGVPVVDAPSEAEAQCASLVKQGMIFSSFFPRSFFASFVLLRMFSLSLCSFCLSLSFSLFLALSSENRRGERDLEKGKKEKEKREKKTKEKASPKKAHKKPEKKRKKNLEKKTLTRFSGAAYAMSSEDMDSLTFGAPRVLRNLMTPASAKLPVQEYDYAKVLEELGLTEDQFVDLCILCGCDYAGTIRGIGPKSALSLIRAHGTIEKVLESLDRGKHPVPEPFPFEQARKLFNGEIIFFFFFFFCSRRRGRDLVYLFFFSKQRNKKKPEIKNNKKNTEPSVASLDQLPPIKFSKPDVEGIVQFLVREKDFDEGRIRGALTRLGSAGAKAQQGRLDSFFKPVAPSGDVRRLGAGTSSAGAKRGAAGGGAAGAGGEKKKMKGKAGGIGRK